jgi:hypothetical protein
MADTAYVMRDKTDAALGIPLDKDPQEKKFEYWFKLWIDNKISYRDLVQEFPDYDASMIHKLLRVLISKFDR